jgi:REP element-mobilizing transposase RayT
MGRATRADFTGGIYHVIARGNNKGLIFNDSKDKGYFLSILKKNSETMGCRIYGYALMDNHYHILIQTMDKKLQEIMHSINNKYSKYFNLKYERVGHVFQGRYTSCIIQNEFYMYNVLRYIHQNPVKAGMCRKVEDYPWSSDKYYREDSNGFVDTSLVINMISSDLAEAKRQYKEWMDRAEDENYDAVSIIGDDAFKILYESKSKPIVSKKSLDEILLETGLSADDFNLLKTGSKKRSLTNYKVLYIREALEKSYTLKEIGRNINISNSAVKELLERYRNFIKS